jgi:hypothetical protein
LRRRQKEITGNTNIDPHLCLQVMPLSGSLVAAAQEAFTKDGARAGLNFKILEDVGSGNCDGLTEADVGTDFYFYVEIWLPTETGTGITVAKAPTVSLSM